jgi:hypothetical protein
MATSPGWSSAAHRIEALPHHGAHQNADTLFGSSKRLVLNRAKAQDAVARH